MNVELPAEVEDAIRTAVRQGRFATVDQALTAAWKSLSPSQIPDPVVSDVTPLEPDPLIGSMSDYAEEMEEIIADVMRRREEPWRTIELD